MSLLNPIWLWALGALAIPVAIHLLSRKEGNTIRIGTIRFLTETSTNTFSSIRLNEILLLVLRSILIILLILFLAGLILSFKHSDKSNRWVLVEKGLEANERVKALTDSLKKNGYEFRRLSEGFSTIDADTTDQSPDYYKLVEDISVIHRAQSIVIARNALTNFKGKRIPLPENITWISYPVQQATSPGKLPLADTVRIILAFDKAFEYDKKILYAAIQSIQPGAPAVLVISEIEASTGQRFSNTDWLIWLSNNKLTYEGKSLHVELTPFTPLLSQQNRDHWLLTERLTETNALEKHLSIQLMKMLFAQKAYSPGQDIRTTPDKMAWSSMSKSEITNDPKTGQPADKILILIIAALFICERIAAFYRRQ